MGGGGWRRVEMGGVVRWRPWGEGVGEDLDGETGEDEGNVEESL